MTNKILDGFLIVGLIALIGVMSWRDMHPHTAANDSSVLGNLVYYAGSDIAPAMIPDDSLPVTIDVGDFSYAPDGKMTWTPHGMPPTTFAQRQVNLQFNFRNLPHDPAQTIEKIGAVIDDWLRKGDMINVFVLNYSPAKADFKGYTALLRAAYDKFSKTISTNDNRYLIFSGIDITWSEETLKSLHEYSPQFVVSLPQAQIPPAFLQKLAALKYNLILQYPPGTQVKDVDTAALKTLGSLSGVTLALDARRPLPKNEEKIGLFPKF